MYSISSRGQPTRGGLPSWVLGQALTTPHCKKYPVTNVYKESLGPGSILLCDLSNGKGTYRSSGRGMWGVWTGSSWLWIRSGDGNLRMRQ